MKRFCEFLGEYAMKIIKFKKKKNEVINKRVVRIIWKLKNVKIQKFVKKNLKINVWKTKNVVKLEIIVIMQGHKEMLHIAHLI